ncbi:ABC transporter related protein (plasmid) [Gemmatirosa kalamazoonensis]|uniref:ABC transporter related protein n=1 Tax=Gemmatirosa kalamazoonensis TaxID=861299 RepID=W0RU16_9BACT|nr:sn-glycerol-3-phosphate ABC transporter ATP-binding protein UgpC [Gemmatirosa kalamazoonensis]AHG93795.1 ABC transporter related protein [Gemmatirosa kalamazoonensis]
MPPISFEHVTKRFGDVRVVEEFDLEVADGELLVLVGGSGSGKSTILRMLAGLETVTTGRIRIGDRDVTALSPKARDVAMVFQDYALYPHMTVRENLSLGLKLRGVARAEIERRVAWAAGILGLEPLLDRRPKALSGGQRQRVAMGRAMVREPAAFLFDEPLSNLDAGLRAQMRVEIGALQRRLGTTTIYVTHDQVEAMTLGDRIVVLANGRVQQVGRPIDLYRAPANRFVAGFIGTPPMNFVPARFAAGSLGVPLPTAGDDLTLGIRPEDVALERTADGTGGAGRVVLVERLGGTSHVHVDVGPHRLVAALTGDALPDVGEAVTPRFSVDRVHLFGADGRALR